jgi:hypothetical protein
MWRVVGHVYAERCAASRDITKATRATRCTVASTITREAVEAHEVKNDGRAPTNDRT